MAKMKCRVCGKEYKACKTKSRDTGIFHWREVACSPECGAVYFTQINESRGISVVKEVEKKKKAPHTATISSQPETSLNPPEARKTLADILLKDIDGVDEDMGLF